MRILYVSSIYPSPENPGRGVYNARLCEALAERNELRVVAPRSWREAAPPADERPVLPTTRPTFYYAPGLLRTYLHEFMWHSIRRHLDEVVREFEPDIVLSYWTHPDGTVAQRAAALRGVPCINMVGGSDVLVHAEEHRRGRIIQETLHNADGLVAVSSNIQNRLLTLGMERDRIAVIPRGIDASVFHPFNRGSARSTLGLHPDQLVVFGCGRLVAVKDWPLFLDACAVLSERKQNLVAAIAGTGELQPQLQQLIERHGLTQHVRLLGDCDPKQLAAWYQAATCTLLTSVSEGIPNVLLESLACGTPFVATRVGGVPEIADPFHDRLIDSRNPIDLAAAVIDLAESTPASPPRRFTPGTWQSSAELLTEFAQYMIPNPTDCNG